MANPDPSVVPARLQALLALGAQAVEALGGRAGQEAADALKLLEAISADTGTLMEVNQQLLPLMQTFQRQLGKRRWWRWFTGEQLEHDVRLPEVCAQVEALVHEGQSGHAGMQRQIRLLSQHWELMAGEIESLEAEIQAGQLLIAPASEAARQAAGIDADTLARLQRRVANLQAMATATELTRAQFKVAIQHAKTVADRYVEIRALLLPIWKQALGFDLFARRVGAHTG